MGRSRRVVVEVRQEAMGLREAMELRQNRFTKYLGLNSSQVINQLSKDTLTSRWYKALSLYSYGTLENYESIEKAIFQMSFLLSFLELTCVFNDGKFKADITARHAAVTVNQAYQLGFRPLWLSESLTQAFCQTHLPSKVTLLKRVCPVGLILFPPVLKSPSGTDLKWVLFYHQLPEEDIFPVILGGESYYFQSSNKPCDGKLYWFAKLDGEDSFYAGHDILSIVDNHLNIDNGGLTVGYRDGAPVPLGKDESSFTNKIVDLIIQTLLYMQMEKITLPPIPEPQPLGFGGKGKTKYQKIPPLIIGENYLIKTQREPTGVSRPHGSPVTHWRSGHWRCQPYGGKDNLAYKTIWIEPILVNKPGG